MARNMVHRLKNNYKIYQPPLKLGFRGHLSEEDAPKVRPIWVQPFETILIESMFTSNVYESLKHQANGSFHFGTKALERLSELLTRDYEGRTTVTLDWSAFDSRCPKWLIEEAFDVLSHVIDFTTMSRYSLDMDDIQMTEKKSNEYKLAYKWIVK